MDARSPMTVESWLEVSASDSGHELVRGELRQRRRGRLDRRAARAEARLVGMLYQWLSNQPEPHGAILSGGACCLMRRDPDTVLELDVVMISAPMSARQRQDFPILDGPPLVAIELLAPADRQQEIHERIDECLAAKVAMHWLVDPHYRTVLEHRPDCEPVLHNLEQRIDANEVLPGFSIAVAEIFR